MIGPYFDDAAVEYTPLDDYDHQLIAAREANPGWDIYRMYGAYVATPAGAVVYAAITVDALVGKLRQHRDLPGSHRHQQPHHHVPGRREETPVQKRP